MAVGGTGAIWKAVAGLLPQHKLRFNSRVVSLDAVSKTVTLADGTTLAYKKVPYYYYSYY